MAVSSSWLGFYWAGQCRFRVYFAWLTLGCCLGCGWRWRSAVWLHRFSPESGRLVGRCPVDWLAKSQPSIHSALAADKPNGISKRADGTKKMSGQNPRTKKKIKWSTNTTTTTTTTTKKNKDNKTKTKPQKPQRGDLLENISKAETKEKENLSESNRKNRATGPRNLQPLAPRQNQPNEINPMENQDTKRQRSTSQRPNVTSAAPSFSSTATKPNGTQVDPTSPRWNWVRSMGWWTQPTSGSTFPVASTSCQWLESKSQRGFTTTGVWWLTQPYSNNQPIWHQFSFKHRLFTNWWMAMIDPVECCCWHGTKLVHQHSPNDQCQEQHQLAG